MTASRHLLIQGKHDDYSWVVSSTHGLDHVINTCPEILLDHYLAITAFDSGAIEPSPEEQELGWFATAGVMFSPKLRSVVGLPHDGYDEWYVFEKPTQFVPDDVFVNYGGFTLEDAERVLERLGTSTDLVGQRAFIDVCRDRLNLFWRELNRVGPETYLAEGDLLVVACRSPRLMDAILVAVA